MATVNTATIAPVQIGWNGETIHSVLGLAEYLNHSWPAATRGDEYLTALMVCHAVLSGSEDDTPDEARNAFVAAARASGLVVYPDDDIALDF